MNPTSDCLDDVPDEFIQETVKRLAVVKEMQQATGTKVVIMRQFSTTHGIGVRALEKWWQAYARYGVKGLIPKK